MIDRRPIAVRSNSLSIRGARLLANAGVTPNQISIASVVLAAIGAASLVGSAQVEDLPRAGLLFLAAICIPGRLLCNMLDGMVAVEFGKQSKSGDVLNELPDRVSDVLFLAAAGYAVPEFAWAVAVGWIAAMLALLTAYVRTLGASLPAPQDFGGPMAKQQRMALLSLGCVGAAIESFLAEPGYSLIVALVVIGAGSLVTVALRTRRLIQRLEQT